MISSKNNVSVFDIVALKICDKHYENNIFCLFVRKKEIKMPLANIYRNHNLICVYYKQNMF